VIGGRTHAQIDSAPERSSTAAQNARTHDDGTRRTGDLVSIDPQIGRARFGVLRSAAAHETASQNAPEPALPGSAKRRVAAGPAMMSL
jgi:hypothetical protein